jgi:zinc protease
MSALPPTVTHTVVNGTHVLIQQRTNMPLLSMAIATRGGSLLEPRAAAGTTALMARTSIKGTPSRTAAQIAAAAERMGGSIAPSGGADLIDWEISVPSRHFAHAFELLADVAFHAHFPAHELEVERKLTLADLEHTRDDMYRYPLRLVMQAAFADHPYGYSLEELERGVTACTAQALRAWRAQRVQAAPWVLLVGHVDEDAALREIERRIPASRAAAQAWPPAPQWPDSARQLVEQRDKAQSALALAFPGPLRGHDDAYALQVLANAVGGLGGRVFEELRSKRSLAYSVSLMPMFRLAAGAFVGYIGTSPEREDEARAGLLEQFALLASQPLSEAEIERSKRYTIGSWQIRRQTNASQLSDLLYAHLLGPGLQEITGFEDRIRAVDAARIQEVAQRYFRPAVAVEGVVRGVAGKRGLGVVEKRRNGDVQ